MSLPKMIRDVEFLGGPIDGKVLSLGVDSPLIEHGWRINIPMESSFTLIEFVGEDDAKLSMMPPQAFAKAVYRVAAGDYHNSPMVAHFEEVAE